MKKDDKAQPAGPRPSAAFVAFYRVRPGAIVHRYGTATPRRQMVLMGAVRDGTTKQIEWKPEIVEALTAHEARVYAREYRRLVRDGDIFPATAEDYDIYITSCSAPKVQSGV